MRKICWLIAVLSIVLVLDFSVPANDSISVLGTVIKIHVPARTVTIRAREGHVVTVVMQDADALLRVREGERGRATYVMHDGLNIGIKLDMQRLHQGC